MDESNLKLATQKMMHFCAYQERCEQEVFDKLQKFELHPEQASEVLAYLKKEKFLDEERFAKAFVRGKFHYSKWGRIKIKQALKQKGLDSEYIAIGLEEIDDKEYAELLSTLCDKKNKSVKAKDAYERKIKLVRYLASKGFEQDLVWRVVEDVLL